MKRADRIAIWLPNCPQWVELALAAKRVGAMVIARSLPELPDGDGDPDAPWLVFTSSGTTGAPKLVVHTQRGIDAHARAVADAFGYRADDAVILRMLPLCGVFGFCTLAGAEAFTEDGFYRSGDLGRETALGFEYLSRSGDALRLGGFIVHPREIEAFLEGLDGVEAAQVVECQGRAVAFVLGAPDEDAVIERCRAELAGFKVPRRVIALDAFPTTPSANGERVQRAELRRMAAVSVD